MLHCSALPDAEKLHLGGVTAMTQHAAGPTFLVARIAFSLVGVVVLPVAAAGLAAAVAAARLARQ